ncbi:peptidase, M23 family [Leptospira mayottensis 200901122]|uniref:Peptidase, M23 family n=1 Tax=Leptospira mayottensis 200901122 TaxID=1193010 RepID=A0AA87MPR4_9LEPT|nr:M23 family metallopeptidase [Leptospira mayottensis]EKS01420.1 peptidase, M23 family [Leptospira mayottensis 200901122]
MGSAGAYGSPGLHDTVQTITVSGGTVEGNGGRKLSAADVADFKADFRNESRAQTDASIAALKSAGYDTSGIEKFVTDFRNGKAANTANQTATVHPTTQQSTGFFTNALNSVVDGAKGLWNRATGGSKQSNSNGNGNGHEIVRIGENGLAEYANGARTSIAFNEKTDGPFSQPRTGEVHGAVDLMTPIGTKVSALEDGVVTISRNKPDDYLRYPLKAGETTTLGGASISIRHTNANGETVYSYYAHNSKVLVENNQKVYKGQVIALSGQSGNTPGGPHIHQEVSKYVDGKRVKMDPLEFSWEKFNANKNEN